MHKFYSLLTALLLSIAYATAQNAESTDIMRSNGKIYVVMAVVVTILTGLFIYLFSVEKKIKKLEQ